MIKDAHRHQVRAILERILPGWTDYLIRLLTLPNTDDAAVLLKVEAIRVSARPLCQILYSQTMNAYTSAS